MADPIVVLARRNDDDFMSPSKARFLSARLRATARRALTVNGPMKNRGSFLASKVAAGCFNCRRNVDELLALVAASLH
jgi:hypothetical protein